MRPFLHALASEKPRSGLARGLSSGAIPCLGALCAGMFAAAFLAPLCGCSPGLEASSSQQQPAYDERVVFLSDGKLVLGVMPEAGGRILHFGLAGGRNVLKIGASLLAKPVPEPAPDSPHYPLNGHEVWVGPQSDWWIRQELNMDRKGKASTWPPDPWLSMGRFSIVKKDAVSILMEGPESPLTGLKMTKEASILPDGSVRIKASAKNCRKEAMEWDLWSNTRLDGHCRPYSPLSSGKVRLEIAAWSPSVTQILQYEIADGFFTFKIPSSLEGKEWIQKAFFRPSYGMLCAFGKDFLFVKSFEAVKWTEAHPLQAPVEIYQFISSKNPGDSLLELEFHGAYKKLEPGESMSIEETWRVFPYDGDSSVESQLRFLKSLKLEKLDLAP